jgi:hypothetical protein
MARRIGCGDVAISSDFSCRGRSMKRGAELLRIVYNRHVKQTVNAINGILGDTAQKTLGEPFTLPARWIDGEKGAAKRIAKETGSSIVQLPFRLAGEVGKGMLRGGRDVAKLAMHLPVILLPEWREERNAVARKTERDLRELLDTMDAERMQG